MGKRNLYIVIIGSLLLPLLIDWFIFGNCFPSNLSNAEWAGFLGSYIGGVCTLIAVFITINDNNQKLSEQAQGAEKQRKEDRRILIQPYIDTRFVYFNDEAEVLDNSRVVTINNSNGVEKFSLSYTLDDTYRKTIKARIRNGGPACGYIQYIIRNAGAGSAVNGTLSINSQWTHRLVVAKDETVSVFFVVEFGNLENYSLNISYEYGDTEGIGKYHLEDTIYMYINKEKRIVSSFNPKGEQKLI